MKENLLKGSFYGFIAILTGVLAFFIMYNAGWIIGDDAIVVSHTGWGRFFNPADTVTPSSGRFFPLAYVIYNILPIFGFTSINAHFALQTIVFVIFCIVSIWASRKAIDAKQLAWQEYMLVISAAIVCIARAYCNFLDAYSTIWVDYTLIMIWTLCCYFVHKNQSQVAMIVGLLSVTYMTFCLETNFIFPLTYGIIGLLFTWKNSTKLEKVYYWSLVGVGVIFLLLYFFICFLHIEEAYDGSHGTGVTVLGNAVSMFIAQKVLWLVLIIVCWRVYRVIAKKDEFEPWDTMLLTGCAYCCGCAVMKLNWVLYYSLASLFMVPALVHYLHKYLGAKWAWIVMLVLALFMSRKIPNYIKTNQKERKENAELIGVLVSESTKGNILYLYVPKDDRELCTEIESRYWLCICLKTLFTWSLQDENFYINQLTSFDSQEGVYILPSGNEILFPNSNIDIMSKGEVLIDNGARGFSIVKVQ